MAVRVSVSTGAQTESVRFRRIQINDKVQKVATEKWTNYTRRHKCQIKQGKPNFPTLVDMFSKIK